MPCALYNIIKEMFYSTGPKQVYLKDKHGRRTIVRRALDWEGRVISDLLCTDNGRFFIKYQERGAGVVVEFMPTVKNRSVNIHDGKLRCAALVYRTFTKEVPTAPLQQCQFKAKDGNGVNFSVDNLVPNIQATAATRKPRNNQKYTVSER